MNTPLRTATLGLALLLATATSHAQAPGAGFDLITPSEARLEAQAEASAPPAAMAMFTAFAPISSMTWSLDLVEEPEPDADWFLMSSRGEAVADGYSSQAMGLWTASGRPVILSRQTVAIFA